MTEELENIMPNEQNESDVQQEELRIPAESDLSLEEPNHLEEVDFEGTESGVVEDVEGEDVKQPEAPASENLAPNEICEGEPCELQEGGKRKKRKKRRKIDEYTLENDIKYRGPLSYRWLRVAAWAFLILSQIGVLLTLGIRFDDGLADKVGFLPSILQMLKEIMMPLFLIATFATILNGSKTFKSMLILYGGAAVLFYILFVLFHERYAAELIVFLFETDRASAIALIDTFLSSSGSSGYIAFNFFIDLFICTLLGFFVLYRPKKIFVGKKLAWFRAFTVIPIAYEIICFTIKLLGSFGVIFISPYGYALLTTKPPMTFVVFLVVLAFIKVRERIYRKRGKTHEDYQEFLKTNANSWQFSGFLAILMVVAGVVDTIIYYVMTFAVSGVNIDAVDVASVESIMFVTGVLLKSGIGGSGALIIASPLMLLFSYTRTHKDTRADMFVPILAIIVLVFVYLEAMVIATNMLGSLSNLISKLGGK